jgi:hypothetical protein
MIPAPTVTDDARRHLAGRALVVRTSVRHGCCGGQASLTVAEVGPPDRPDGYRTIDVDGLDVYIDRRLDAAGEAWHGDWTIAVDGIRRWKRLVVLDGRHDQ